MFDFLFGVSEEIRVINKNPLYDLKYRGFLFNKKAVRTGLEPVTPCVTGMYSNQLN